MQICLIVSALQHGCRENPLYTVDFTCGFVLVSVLGASCLNWSWEFEKLCLDIQSFDQIK